MSASVFNHAAVGLLAPHSRFTLVEDPFHSHTDQPWHQGIATWYSSEDVVCDYDLQAVYPKPLRVLHDMTEGYSYGNTDLTLEWTNSGTVPFDFRTSHPLDFEEFHVKQTKAAADSGLFDAEASVSCQGVTFLWSRNDQVEADSGSNNPRFTTFRIGVGNGTDRHLYSVRYQTGGDAVIAKSEDLGQTWRDLQVLAVGADQWSSVWAHQNILFTDVDRPVDEETADADYEYNVLEVRLIAGRLMFKLGSQDQVFVFDEFRVDGSGNALWTIDHIRIRAYKFLALACSAHPMKWRPASSYISSEFVTGFYSTNIGAAYIDPAGVVPFGWNAFIDGNNSSLTGPICQYRLVFDGPVDGSWRGDDFSHYCAAVRAVSINWLANRRFIPAAPIPVEPEVVNVKHSFDPATLQIASYGALTFNNNRRRNLPTGQFGTWGEWMRAYGHVAIDVGMTRTTISGALPPPGQVFGGYGNVDGSMVQAAPGGSQYVMLLGDRRRQLTNQKFALPWMDGWNVFYAMAYLAQQGGVDISEMDFAQYVPSVPFGPGSDLGSPEGPAYYLPVGDVGSVLTRFSGAPLWDVMTRIAFSIGYMLFFDVYGRLQFRKFRLPLGVKRRFYESDRESQLYQAGGGLEGCWSVRATKNMGEVRNVSIVIGLNTFSPRYDPVVYKWVDLESIYNPNAFNHLGYEMGTVWMDSQFANPDFAFFASAAMYEFLRYPGYSVGFSTWLQPDIFPLDVITVESPKVGTYGVRMMVIDVDHKVMKDGGTSDIVARFIPDVLT